MSSIRKLLLFGSISSGTWTVDHMNPYLVTTQPFLMIQGMLTEMLKTLVYFQKDRVTKDLNLQFEWVPWP